MFNRGAKRSPLILNFEYHGNTTKTADATSFTFGGASIGVPNAERMVVVAWQGLTTALPSWSATIGGIGCTELGGDAYFLNGAAGGVFYAKVPTGNTADIVLNFSGNTFINCSIQVYSFNTKATGRVDQVQKLSGSSDLVTYAMNNVQCKAGGVVIYSHAGASTKSRSSTWNGVDSAVETYDSTVETRRGSSGYVLTTEDSTARDLTCTVASGGDRGEAQCVSFEFID